MGNSKTKSLGPQNKSTKECRGIFVEFLGVPVGPRMCIQDPTTSLTSRSYHHLCLRSGHNSNNNFNKLQNPLSSKGFTWRSHFLWTLTGPSWQDLDKLVSGYTQPSYWQNYGISRSPLKLKLNIIIPRLIWASALINRSCFGLDQLTSNGKRFGVDLFHHNLYEHIASSILCTPSYSVFPPSVTLVSSESLALQVHLLSLGSTCSIEQTIADMLFQTFASWSDTNRTDVLE